MRPSALLAVALGTGRWAHPAQLPITEREAREQTRPLPAPIDVMASDTDDGFELTLLAEEDD